MDRTSAEPTPHIFFSYSRVDAEFTRRLNEALKAAGRRTWVDLEGIPLSAEWLAEINAAIDGAEACVFVLSPDWVASEICRAELRYAVENNKRLIPLLFRDAGKDVPDELAKINWLHGREEDDFAAMVEALLATVDTDLDHVRVHTRLLVRAHEWKGRFEEPSRLLGGKQLREAGAWLEASPDKEPEPTPLHQEYLMRSAQRARRRRRLVRGGLALAAILALAATIFASDRNQKIEAIALARQGQELASRRPADGLVYAILAAGATRVDGAIAGALGVAGVEGARRRYAPEVRSSLFAGFQNLAMGTVEKLVIDTPGTEPVQAVVFSPDGGTVVAGSDHGTVQIWDLAGNLVAESPQGPKAWAVDTSGDGAWIVSGHSDNVARVHALQPDGTLGLEAQTNAGRSAVRSVAVSPVDEELIAIGNSHGQLLLWSWRTGQLTSSARGRSGDEVKAVAFSPDGRTLAGAGSASGVKLWDREARELEAAWRLADGSEAPAAMREALAVAFSPDGRTLVSGGGADGVVRLWSRGEGPLRWDLAAEARGHSVHVASLAFAPDGESFVSSSFDGTVRHWDLAGRPLRRPLRGPGQPVPSIAFSPDGKTVAGSDWGANIRLWELTAEPPGRVVGRHGDATAQAPPGTRWEIYRKVNAVAIDADGDAIVSGGHDGIVRLWDRQGRLVDEWPRGGLDDPRAFQAAFRVSAVAISEDGRTIASGAWDQSVRLWQDADDLAAGRVVREGFGQVRTVGLSADGRTLVSGGGNVTTGALAWRDGEPLELAEFESFENDGKQGQPLVVIGADGATIVSTRGADRTGPIRVWSPPWTLPRTLEESAFGLRVNAVAVSASGETIASADQGGFIRLWSGDGAAISGELTGHFGAVYSVGLSRDGRVIASGSGDTTLRLWDRRGNRIGEPLEGHESLVSSLAISGDGRLIVSGSWDGTVRLWPLGTTEDWLEAACEWVRSYIGVAQMRPEIEKARAVCASRDSGWGRRP